MDDDQILALLKQSIMDTDDDPDSSNEDPSDAIYSGDIVCCTGATNYIPGTAGETFLIADLE